MYYYSALKSTISVSKDVQWLAKKLDFLALSFINQPFLCSLKATQMLVKIHDFFKISLNLCEIHHNEFWFQNSKHFQRCRTWNFDFSFLCSKMSFFKLKRLELFYCWIFCNQKFFRSSLHWYKELRQGWWIFSNF